jgi:hypothetical protein
LTAAPYAVVYARSREFVTGYQQERLMDISPFDRIAMTVAKDPSRRDLLRLLGAAAIGAGSLTLLGSNGADAKRRKKRKNKKKGSGCKGRCGGKCPRCEAGKSCQDRHECTTAFCDGGVCTVPDDAGQCGLDTDGVNGCFRRENKENGEFYCSRQTCRFIGEGSCNQCTGQEICSPAGGDNIECCTPCGA